MRHPYEYAVMVDFLAPIAIGGSPDFANEPAQQALTAKLGELTNRLPAALDAVPRGNGWEINSHNIVLAGNTIIISFLLQRPRI